MKFIKNAFTLKCLKISKTTCVLRTRGLSQFECVVNTALTILNHLSKATRIAETF